VAHNNGQEVVTGTHEIRDGRLIHREQSGPYACTVAGTYTWDTSGGAVSFTAVEDGCGPRVSVVTIRPWSRDR
jgi:hypothetical protein